jgi:antitoxin (DNA-binding transcriptional repressor) of toxin-antitoxin stability system
MIHTMATATIRDLRTKFPKVRRLVESNGEVIVTERGEPRFLLRPYRAETSKKPLVIDFYKRLVARMPKMLSEAQSRAIDNLNRGES